MIAANPNCPACHGSGIDPDSKPTYHDGAPGIPDPAGYEPCGCVLAQAETDSAVEHVVKSSADTQALTDAVRELAGLLGYDLVVKAPIVHRFYGGHWEGEEVYIAACGQPDPAHTGRMGLDISCPDCLATLRDDAVAAVVYETDPELKPRDGEHGTCVFGCAIRYIDCPTGGWWAHDEHPADGHDAALGGPA